MTDALQSTGQPRLVMRGVSKCFGATHALKNVDFEVFPGEILALIGENGAGKSTLMKVLSGAHQPDSGSMVLDGRPYRPRHPLAARSTGVGMIYQELSLAPHLSVMENILLGIEPALGPFVRWKEVRTTALRALSEIGLDQLDPATPVHHLSIAQQQMVEIARAVAFDCRLLVLDEPTSSLSQADIKRLFELIERLKQKNISVVYISHFLEEVKEISDRITVLRDGESVGSRITSEVKTSEIVALMVGRNVEELYPRSERPNDRDVLMKIEKLSGFALPHSASLALQRGRVLGIAGLVGAGRTEFLRAIFALDKIRSGKVTLATFTGGRLKHTPASRWEHGVGLVSEDRKCEGLALNLSVADNITLPKLSGLGPARWVIPGRQRTAARCWIERIQIKCRGPGQPVSALSGGNQQKVALARLLHANVDVLLLDEPTRGIDVGSKAQIYRLIDELAQGDTANGRIPKSILLVSSYLPELMGICDEICVMCRGKLTSPRPTNQWSEHELMMVATGQTSVPASRETNPG